MAQVEGNEGRLWFEVAEIWAPLGTDDPAGRRIRELAFENIHELAMDESGAEELDPQGIPSARLEEIPGADHVLNVRQPDAFNRSVLAFLDEARS